MLISSFESGSMGRAASRKLEDTRRPFANPFKCLSNPRSLNSAMSNTSAACPLVSIVTPVHNAASYLADTIKSIQQQTLQNWELLLIDDCSSDDSQAICRTFAATDSRIVFEILPVKGGPARARNTAIRRALGRYIAFCDSDDIWMANKLELQIEALQSSDAAICFSSYLKMEEDGTKTSRIVHAPPSVNYSMMLRSCYIGCSTAIYDTQRCGKIEMPDIAKRQDYGLWLRILEKGHTGIGLDTPLAHWRVRSDSVSSKKLVAASYHWKVLREVAHIKIPHAIWLFVQYAWLGFRKHQI